jgi:hypothetical protein
MLIDTRTIKNFLSEEEIIEIEDMHNKGMTTLNVDINKTEIGIFKMANIWDFRIYNDIHARLKEILLPKLQQHFHKDIYVDDCHILESFHPYSIHTDASSEPEVEYTINPGEGMTPAWTFIIPLADYNSNTIIFDQETLNIKSVNTWIEQTNPPILNSISGETFDKYLKKVVVTKAVPYLSIEQIFLWKKGDLSAASRAKFHTSDYFPDNGITTKRAIVMWTSLPKNAVPGR